MSLLNYRIISLTLCAFLLSACNSMNLNVDQPQNRVQTTDNSASQDNDLPASIYHPQKATKISEELSTAYELAKSLYLDANYERAIETLDNDVLVSPSPIQFEAYLLAALAASQMEDTVQSFEYLKEAELLSIARHPDNQNRIKEVKASVLEHFSHWRAVVSTRMDLSYNLAFDEGEENQGKLWRAIQNLTQNEIDAFYQQEQPLLNGWLTISETLRNQTLSIDQQIKAFEQWRLENPNHPASILPPEDFQIMSSIKEMAPERIVLMLPLGGNLERASQAVIDGFFASFYNQKEDRPQVFIIDVNNYSNISDALFAANEKQPDVIIGPLQKSNVAQISRLNLPYPVIALNQLDINQTRKQLYHFSLSPEDEIKEIISFAKQNGATKAAILSIQDTWALKQSDEFRDAALKENITITSNQAYSNTPKGRQDAIQKLLLIDESHARKKLVERWTRTKVDSIARSRKDLDYVYYVGKLNDAKQIRPLIDFYFADEIPMLASSTLNDSAPEKSTNPSDIERILFTEIPALTPYSEMLAELDKNQHSNILRRLQALGADSYLLANKYQLFTLLPSTKVSANTGIITIDNNGIFHKRPEIMTYRKGNLVYANIEQFFETKEETEE